MRFIIREYELYLSEIRSGSLMFVVVPVYVVHFSWEANPNPRLSNNEQQPAA